MPRATTREAGAYVEVSRRHMARSPRRQGASAHAFAHDTAAEVRKSSGRCPYAVVSRTQLANSHAARLCLLSRREVQEHRDQVAVAIRAVCY
jgi:hypothetical protein